MTRTVPEDMPSRPCFDCLREVTTQGYWMPKPYPAVRDGREVVVCGDCRNASTEAADDDPSPAEILAAAAAIRSEWSARELRKRGEPSQRWTPPAVVAVLH